MATDHRTQWVFVFASGLGALGLAVAVLAVSGIDPEGIRRSLRVTARFSFILFWCAYAGGSLAVLFNVHFRWMARQGRDFGLSFASAHSIHLLLVIWLYRLSPEPPISTQGAVFFSIGLLWMYLLVLFSVERLSRSSDPACGVSCVWSAWNTSCWPFSRISSSTPCPPTPKTCRSMHHLPHSAWQARRCV